MSDINSIKEQFLSELLKMRQTLAELDALEEERQKAEAALREIEECYRTLFE
jgi:predicted component of type VI protein secretion system